MEHWKWSKNWVCEGLSNRAQNASAGDGAALTESIDSSGLVEGAVMPLPHLADVTARANAGLPAPAKLGACVLGNSCVVLLLHV